MNINKASELIKSTVKNDRLGGLVNLSAVYLNMLKEPQIMSTMPLFVQIEPTLHCNLSCSMCINPVSSRAKRHMDFDEFKRILGNVPIIRQISLVGAGEPLMNPALFEMIKHAKANGVLIGFATNGMLLNQDNCRKIIDARPDWINISVDSADKKKFESIREGADFDLIVENINRLLKFRGNEVLPDISLWFVFMTSNLDEVFSLISFAKKLGIKKVFSQMQHTWGIDFGVKFNPGELTKVSAVIKQAKKNATREGILFDYVNVPDVYAKRGCKWPWKAAYITAEGFITPCCLQGSNPDIINFGNIFRTDFKDIWNNSAYQDFRKRLKSETPPAICKGCTAYHKKIKI